MPCSTATPAPLTIAGAVRDARVVARCERASPFGARIALDTPVRGRSASPLGHQVRSSSGLTLLLCFTTLAPCHAMPPAGLTQQDACTLLQKRISKVMKIPEGGPIGMGWFCDFSTLEDKHWYVIALRSNRQCEGICSNLMGWYAVNRVSGSIHQYDVAELKVGSKIK